MRKQKLSLWLAAALFTGAGTLVDLTAAHAQSSTSGALRGVIKDKASGEEVVGATLVATSPAMPGEQVVISDENGLYFFDNLPPGLYLVTVYYNDTKFSRSNVLIQVGKQSLVNIPISTAGAGTQGETIVIEGHAPIVDQGSTKTGVTLTSDYSNNVPVARTFGGVLGQAPGSQGDQYGISFSGSTSLENTYIIEGLNTTDTGYGKLSTNLPNEFVQETEVITGGYNAEFGRSTGGVVNVVTKQGSNEFSGSVFAYYTPGALVAQSRAIPREGSAIRGESNLDYSTDIGAEVGGPILKDKLWFHLGFNPSFSAQTLNRIVSSRIDGDGDGAPDVDPETGFTLTDEVARRELPISVRTMFFTGKVNGALNQNHQFQLSVFGNPRHVDDVFGITRNPAATRYQYDDGAYDGAVKWTSKFADGKTQVDLVVGYHHGYSDERPLDASGNVPLVYYGYTRPLYDFAGLEGAGDIAACEDDGADDPYPMIANCPVNRYAEQGLGYLEERTNDRKSLVLSVTQRVKALGYHTFKAGLDAELATFDALKHYTGDAVLRRSSDSDWTLTEFMHVTRNLTIDERMALRDDDPGNDPSLDPGQLLCAGDNAVCENSPGGMKADTNNRNLGAYLQDSWQVRPNLTINAGVRWEQQTAYVADSLKNQISPEGEVIPEVAFKLNNMLAPRIGVIYDPTSEGRGKLFAHVGRFYETVPMDINVRAFGGEISALTALNGNYRAPGDPDYDTNCDVDHGTTDIASTLRQCSDAETLAVLGGGSEYVSPGIKGQHIDEFIIGAEYELASDFKMGLNYIHRELPVVIEDISTDGGNNYLITNPGEDFGDEARVLEAEGEALLDDGDVGNDALGELMVYRASLLDAVGRFDKPSRTYDGVQLTATQRPTKHSLLLASYTYSRSRGNFPGLFSTETGQDDANLTTMYDLPDLMANRYGALGHDRPHLVKIDGFYEFNFRSIGMFTLGGSFRAQSGIAHNALGAHPIYETDESYLLPRGSMARSPMTWDVDLKASYGRTFGKTTVEVFADVFNLFNNQDEVDVDETYTYDNVIPVVGGTMQDLEHSKTSDSGGYQVNQTPTKNPNFGKLNARQSPLSARFGLRVTF
jgi:hypothetical protein